MRLCVHPLRSDLCRFVGLVLPTNNWGGMDYQDVMAGVNAALKQYPWVDSEKLGVAGGSYGGYLTNWVVGHTNRFKAAVTLRAISNFISVEGTRDVAYGHEEYFKGILFDDFEQYWDASPLKYARNVKTRRWFCTPISISAVPSSKASSGFARSSTTVFRRNWCSFRRRITI